MEDFSPHIRASGFYKSYMLPSSFLLPSPSLPLPFPSPFPFPCLPQRTRSKWALPDINCGDPCTGLAISRQDLPSTAAASNRCGRGVKRNPRTQRSNPLTSRPIPCPRNWRTNQGSLSLHDFPHADRCLRDPWHCPCCHVFQPWFRCPLNF